MLNFPKPILWSSSLFADVSEYAEELRLLERRVAEFNERRSADALKTRPVVFFGSSSIRLWHTLETDFPNVTLLNLGFGGSTMSQCASVFQRIVLPARPRALVFYAGDNDLAKNHTPEAVERAFRDLVRQADAFLPGVPIAYIAIKPSPSRWHLQERIRQTNRLIAQAIADARKGGKQTHYVDIFPKMLTHDGRPRPELFVQDMLHMNRDGYRIWVEELRPVRGIITADDKL